MERVDIEKSLNLPYVGGLSLEKTQSVESSTVVEESQSEQLEKIVDDEYPDGGWAAWSTVLGAFFALLCTFGQLSSFGTFQSWYSQHQLSHLPPSTISWIGSIQLWVFFFSGGFVGRLFDAYGPRVLVIPGTLVLVLSIMLTSICKAYYQYILSQGVLFGLGVGLLFYPSLSAISTHFRKYRATALGIALAGSGVGGVVFPIMHERLFLLLGFGWGVRVSGFLCLGLCSLSVCMVNSRLAPRKSSAPWFDMKHFRDARYVLLLIGCFIMALGLFIPNIYIISYALEHGVPSQTAFYVLAIVNGAGILGRLAPTSLSDVLGRFNMIIPCAFLAGLSTVVIWIFAKSLASIMIFAVVFGFFSGGFNALIVPCIGQISEIREIGTRIGMLYSLLSFSSLAGGPVAGALLKHLNGSYVGSIVFGGATIMVGSAFMLWSRLHINPLLNARV